MLIINRIQLSDSNRRVDFKYELSKDIQKYFSKKSFFVKYDMDISAVPEEILIIPLLANIMPIAWFANFDVKVEKVDARFLESLTSLKQEFSKYYNLKNLKSNNLIFKENIIGKTSDLKNEAMLFSGGVDAYTTYLRHHPKNLHLITIKGADIKLDDEKQWKDLVDYLHNAKVINNNPKHTIESNIREFITFEVDKLLPNLGWWGKIQHGMALTCLTAPICYLHQIKTLYIASSYTRKENYDFIPWGSMPEIDNRIRFNLVKVVHDAAELTRQEKIDLLSHANLHDKIFLRVCYNEFKNNLNCSRCEKCLRTIYAILINNVNPNYFGFNINVDLFSDLYKILDNDFRSSGNKLFWTEIYEKSIVTNKKYNDEEWSADYKKFEQILQFRLNRSVKNVSFFTKYKHSIISSFPRMFNLYMKIRRKFI